MRSNRLIYSFFTVDDSSSNESTGDVGEDVGAHSGTGKRVITKAINSQPAKGADKRGYDPNK